MVHFPPVMKLTISTLIDVDLPARPQSLGALHQLSQFFRRWSVRSAAVEDLCRQHLSALDSLQFIYDHAIAKPGTPFARFAAATCAAFSSNLRELTISIETPQRLGLCLPAVGSISSLPRLETMRLSFWAVPPYQAKSVGKARLQQLVQLYASQTLQTLEIRFKHYPEIWRLPLGCFLPPVESVGSLQTFSFWLPDDTDYVPTY